MALNFGPEFKGRDGCRTPMLWDDSNNAGFSDAKAWLPIDTTQLNRSVQAQRQQPQLLMAAYASIDCST